MTKPPSTNRNSALVLNWIFIPGLLLLLLNDHYLKYEFPGWITGKLSDLAGLLIFPLFLQFIFPRFGRFSVLITGIFFVFWKLPVADPMIALYNKVAIIPIARTVDYSDLVTLAILPLTDHLGRNIDKYKIHPFSPRLVAVLVVIPAALVFMATEPPAGYRMAWSGEVLIGKTYLLKMTRDDALARIKAAGFAVETDTSIRPRQGAAYYQIKNVVLEGDKDTIEGIHFSLREAGGKTFLDVSRLKLKNGVHDLRHWRRLSKYYRRLIRSDLVQEVR